MKGPIILGLFLALCSCSPRVIREVETVTRIEHDTLTRVVEVPIKIQVPYETHTAISDSLSFLETSVAESTASIDSLGRIHHSIRNKNTTLRDTIIVTDTVFRFREFSSTSSVEQKTEQIPWYDKLLISIGKFTLILLLLLAVYLVIRRAIP